MSVLNQLLAAPPRRGTVTFATLGGLSSLPLPDLHEQAGRLAVALAREGVRRGDRIGVLSANRLEWVLLDLAALRLGAVTAGFEPVKFDPDPELPARYDLAMLFADRGDWPRPISDVAGLIAGVEPGAAPPDLLALPAVAGHHQSGKVPSWNARQGGLEDAGNVLHVAGIDGGGVQLD